MAAPSERSPQGQHSRSNSLLKRILRLPAWRAGFGLLGIASAGVYITAMGLDALLSQVLAAFATGGSVMVGLGRSES